MGLWHKRKGKRGCLKKINKSLEREAENTKQQNKQYIFPKRTNIPTIWDPMTDEERQKLDQTYSLQNQTEQYKSDKRYHP
jgi:hypothetical protein